MFEAVELASDSERAGEARGGRGEGEPAGGAVLAGGVVLALGGGEGRLEEGRLEEGPTTSGILREDGGFAVLLIFGTEQTLVEQTLLSALDRRMDLMSEVSLGGEG